MDWEAVLKAAKTGRVITVEEHVAIGGMGSMVSQIIAANTPCKVVNLTLPDASAIAGTSQEVFRYYGLDADSIVKTARELLK